MMDELRENLTPSERMMVEKVENGDSITFEDVDTDANQNIPSHKIRAWVLKRILMGLPVLIEDKLKTVFVPGYGVKIINAHIEGKLFLDNGCFPNGDPLPRLSLSHCFIPDRISMRSCRIRRLCLQNSQISHLRASDAVIGSQLDIEGIYSSHTEKGAQNRGLCRVSLRGAHVADGIEARNAKLASPPKRENFVPYEMRSHYALDLSGLTSGGDIRLFPDFEAIGGVNMSGAHITGSVQAHGARVTKEEHWAFDLDGAHITGKLALCARTATEKPHLRPFVAEGDIDMTGATVGNLVNLRGANICGSLDASYITVGGDFICEGADGYTEGVRTVACFTCTEKIRLNAADIKGSIKFNGAKIDNDLEVLTANIGGSFNAKIHTFKNENNNQASWPIEHFEAKGTLKLDGARIARNIDLSQACLKGGLYARGIHVQGYCHMYSLSENSAYRFICGDWDPEGDPKIWLDLSNAEIGLDLDMSGAQIEGQINARNMVVGGNLLLRAAYKDNAPKPEHPFLARGRVNISGSKIKGDLTLYNAELRKGLRARGIEVSSALVIQLAEIKLGAGDSKNPPRENGADAYIDDTIDLTNARANIVIDGPGNGEYYKPFMIALEGFRYGRFMVEQDGLSSTNPESRSKFILKKRNKNGDYIWKDTWKNRKLWLNRQYTKPKNATQVRTEYKADTYVTLYQVLKNNGLIIESDKILIEKLKIENRMNKMPIRFLNGAFGLYSGYGLQPIRALSCFCVYCVIVAVLISRANDFPEKSAMPKYNLFDKEAAKVLLKQPIKASISLGSSTLNLMGFNKGVLIVLPNPQSAMETSHAQDPQNAHDYYEVTGERTITEPSKQQAHHVQQVLCGSRINPVLYALDMIIPGMKFNQTNRCDFSQSAGPMWLTFKAIASLVGWILTSVTALTLSGLARRQIEPK